MIPPKQDQFTQNGSPVSRYHGIWLKAWCVPYTDHYDKTTKFSVAIKVTAFSFKVYKVVTKISLDLFYQRFFTLANVYSSVFKIYFCILVLNLCESLRLSSF